MASQQGLVRAGGGPAPPRRRPQSSGLVYFGQGFGLSYAHIVATQILLITIAIAIVGAQAL
jgi:hypothetical protein